MDKEKPTTIEALAAMIQNTMASKEDISHLATNLEHVEKRLSDSIATLSTKIDAKASTAETTDLLEEVHGLDKRVSVLEQKHRT